MRCLICKKMVDPDKTGHCPKCLEGIARRKARFRPDAAYRELRRQINRMLRGSKRPSLGAIAQPNKCYPKGRVA